MEIQAGEYIRYKDGVIIKAIEEEFGFYNIDLENNHIVKHSFNLIDLIEVNDYVNGYRILEKTKIRNNEMQVCILKDINSSNWITINKYTLTSIVTKEAFASVEYKVERKD